MILPSHSWLSLTQQQSVLEFIMSPLTFVDVRYLLITASNLDYLQPKGHTLTVHGTGPESLFIKLTWRIVPSRDCMYAWVMKVMKDSYTYFPALNWFMGLILQLRDRGPQIDADTAGLRWQITPASLCSCLTGEKKNKKIGNTSL